MPLKIGGGIKKINNLFKSKKKNVKYTDYLIFIDEHFIYFCKNTLIFSNEPNIRRIGSVVSFLNLNEVLTEIDKESSLFKIKLNIQIRKDIHKTKEFFIEKENYNELIDQFKNIINEYNINCKI